MKSLILILITFIFSSFSLSQEKDFSGKWLGKLNVGATTLTVVINLTKNDNEKYSATLDSPDQLAYGIKVDTLDFDGLNLRLVSNIISAVYSAKYDATNSEFIGKFTQGGMPLDLNLKKVDKVEGPKRPQTPQPPFPYTELEVTFQNKKDAITLAGTLTYPSEGKKIPAVVMITGSGPQDRDENIFGHKIFMVIADYLTRNGIAVLRFDDRGVGKSTGTFKGATSFDFANDVSAAVEFLKTKEMIDKNNIGLIGHSEGGLIAPIVGTKRDDLAFLILLAGTGLRGDSILLLQSELIARKSGESESMIKKSNDANRKFYSLIISETDSIKLKSETLKYLDGYKNTLTEGELKRIGDWDQFVKRILDTILDEWFKTFVRTDPKDFLTKIKIPVLALIGEHDLQVPPKENLEAIEKYLLEAGNNNFITLELKGLNHLFQECKTCTVAEYGQLEETFSPVALGIMSNWILQNVK
ncbi:MAG: alpha/beta hydrolase [Chlorobiaceae bacterium]|nr:alpha/beta hydrolase [Chlorobiaceae bacterium]MBA4309818.1 alpha/beta hydrolase [Chlorobiaceae bacterium]